MIRVLRRPTGLKYRRLPSLLPILRGVTDSDDVAARRRRVAEDIAKKTARMYKEN